MDFNEILYDKSERIATITLNRPQQLNAWTTGISREVRDAMRDANADPEVGAIIMTGAGKAFCSGADFGALNRVSKGEAPVRVGGGSANMEELGGAFRSFFSWMLAIRKPIISAINGPAVGMGLVCTLYHDFRLAAQSARMGLMFVRRGLGIEMGASWMLPRLVGLPNALDLSLTGRLVDASEALRMGLVNRVVPDGELMGAARELAGQIATQCTPLGVGWAKRLIYQSLSTDLAAAVAAEEEAIQITTRSEDFKEGLRAFKEKRAPRFIGR